MAQKSFASRIKFEAENNVNFKVYPDRIIARKDGSVELRRTFFYTFGMNADQWVQDVISGCAACEINVVVVASKEVHNDWPKDSYFTVTVQEA